MVTEKNQLISMLKRNSFITKLDDYKELLDMVKHISKNLKSENNVAIDERVVKVNFGKSDLFCKAIKGNEYYFTLNNTKRTQKLDKLLKDLYHLLYIFFVDIDILEIRPEPKLELLIRINKITDYSDIVSALKSIFRSKKEREELKRLRAEKENNNKEEE